MDWRSEIGKKNCKTHKIKALKLRSVMNRTKFEPWLEQREHDFIWFHFCQIPLEGCIRFGVPFFRKDDHNPCAVNGNDFLVRSWGGIKTCTEYDPPIYEQFCIGDFEGAVIDHAVIQYTCCDQNAAWRSIDQRQSHCNDTAIWYRLMSMSHQYNTFQQWDF